MNATAKDIRIVLAENLEKLMKSGEGPRTQMELKAKTGIAQSTIGRMLNTKKQDAEKNSARISSVAQIAKAYGLESWMLLVPDLDPKRKWKLSRSDEPAPEEVAKAQAIFQKLSPSQKDMFVKDGLVENIINGKAATDAQVAKYLPPAPKHSTKQGKY